MLAIAHLSSHLKIMGRWSGFLMQFWKPKPGVGLFSESTPAFGFQRCIRKSKHMTAHSQNWKLQELVTEASAAMAVEKLKTTSHKKILICVLSVITIIIIFTITRGHMDIRDWRTITVLSCKENGENKSLIFSHLQETMIDRMLYEKPEALKPPRTDVLAVTPWLAPIVWNRLYNIDLLNAQFHKRGVHIGLTVFAIRKYTQFIEHFLDTAEKFFMTGHRVTYYVMTDQPAAVPNITLGEKRKMVVLEVPAYKRWQDITMRRMQIIRDYIHDRFINEVDYLVCLDVDMEFKDQVGVEILSDVYGVIHPGFFTSSRKEFTNERRPQSAGYIPEDEGDFYYTGSHFGGTVEEIYKLTNHCHHAMLADKDINIEARWHDESYLNRYFLYYKPTKVLSPEYSWNYYYGDPAVVEKKRFIVFPKDYAKVRDNP